MCRQSTSVLDVGSLVARFLACERRTTELECFSNISQRPSSRGAASYGPIFPTQYVTMLFHVMALHSQPFPSVDVQGAPIHHTLRLERVMFSSVWPRRKHVCSSHRSLYLTHANPMLSLVRRMDKGVSRSSMVSPPSGGRRSRSSHSGSHPRRESLHRAGEEVDEPTPFRYSRLPGMGDSDCAEWACRIARLSLRLVSPSGMP